MPGYTRSARRITTRGSLRAAWNSLDLFSAAAAQDFLAEKLARISDDEEVQNVALEIILGFGVLAVEAEREEVEALAAIDTSSPPDPKSSEPSETEPERKDIPW